MVPKPDIVWIGSPNFGYPRGTKGRKNYPVIAIVDHIMEGTLSGTDTWFNNPKSSASSTFGVGKDGTIHQYVDLNDAAWANGRVAKPSWPLIKEGVNPNLYTISIEHEGWSGKPLTEAEYQATLNLHRWLIEEFKFPVNKDTIIGHYRIDSVNRSQCPGKAFPWERLFKDLGEDDIMDYSIVYYTVEDFMAARWISQLYGYCAVYERKPDQSINPDALQAKCVIAVGGPKDINHPNVIYLSGQTKEDTVQEVINHIKAKKTSG